MALSWSIGRVSYLLLNPEPENGLGDKKFTWTKYGAWEICLVG